jgi:hypothetical protein
MSTQTRTSDDDIVAMQRATHDSWCIVTSAHDATDCAHLSQPINERIRQWAVVAPNGDLHSLHPTRTRASNEAGSLYHTTGEGYRAVQVLLRVEAVIL